MAFFQHARELGARELAPWSVLKISGFADPFPAQGPLPYVSLRPTLSPPSFGPSLFSGPPPSWTGAYFGANAGYIADGGSAANVGAFPIGYGAFPSDIAVLFGNLTPNGASFIGGGQFGYNLQMSNIFLLASKRIFKVRASKAPLLSRTARLTAALLEQLPN